MNIGQNRQASGAVLRIALRDVGGLKIFAQHAFGG